MGNCHKQMLVSDELLGSFDNVSCGDSLVLWSTNLKSAFGSVTVQHSGGCETMNVYINNKRVFSLEEGQSRAVTVDDLRKLSIQCTGGATPCSGNFEIDLHYLQPTSDNTYRVRGENDEVVSPVFRNRICRY